MEQFFRLSWKRKLILVLAMMAAVLLVPAQVGVVTSYMFEGGQKFGIVVTSWTALVLATVLAWRAAR